MAKISVASARERRKRARYVLIMPCWMLLVVEMRGRFKEDTALGPVFSNQVWSTIWLAIDWPSIKLSLGARR